MATTVLVKTLIISDKAPDKFEPGRGYSKKDWDDVSDNPEWTEEDLRNARSFAEVFPELAEAIRRSRSEPPVDQSKKKIS